MSRVRVVAHLVWLEWPYIGRSCYFCERDGKAGFIPATQPEDQQGRFVGINDKNLLKKVMKVVRPVSPSAEAIQAEAFVARGPRAKKNFRRKPGRQPGARGKSRR